MPTEAPSATKGGGEAGDASPTVTVYARTGAPADEILAGASEAVQKAPSDVLSSVAGEELLWSPIRGPVQYARVTKSSVLTKRMKWFTDEELDGVTYLVVVPYWEERHNRMSYLLATARSATDLRDGHDSDDLEPADLSSLGEVQTLMQADLDSVSDWRPFMNRVMNPSEIR
ncbi:hypothetical protein [Kineosporia sp. NBRC 101731]|uniref:hypothetical protein n=1 Tax=Kineosporia sp. NBRC 101731 TaxID=3032199 RepID=UPI00255622B2|nr:hypothetical protein [Kineosporia sp. NBRC 101731]